MKHLLVLIAFVFGLQTAFAQQDSIYYYKGNYRPATKETATYYREFKVIDSLHFEMRYAWKINDNKWGDVTINRIEKLNDSIFKIRIFKNIDNNRRRKKRRKKINEVLVSTFTRKYIEIDKGIYTFFDYDDKGELQEKGQTLRLFPLQKNGKISTYEDKYLSDEAVYNNGIFISNVIYNPDGSVYDRNICPLPDTFIKLNDGHLSMVIHMQIRKYFTYPTEATEQRISGKVIVQFVIDENLEIKNIKILKNPHDLLTQEAIRIIKQFKFEGKPPTVAGKPIRMLFVLPITFKLAH